MGDPVVSAVSPARRAALEVLVAAERQGAYARDLLDRMPCIAHLDARDRGFCRRLVLGVTAASGSLDEQLDRFLSHPNKVSARVRTALRISVFEMAYLGTAQRVAVSQGVELVRSVARSASGLANAVLRRVAGASDAYLGARDVDAPARPHISASRRAGVPVWLGERLFDALGDDAARGLLGAELEAAPVSVHLRPDASVPSFGSVSELPGCLVGADVGSLVRSGSFDRAELVASDLHAQLIATAAVRPGSCLEIGAGRGTKTFVMCCQAVRAGYTRRHVAVDLSEGKCTANLERIRRAGFDGVTALSGDARDLDAVLAEVDRSVGRLYSTVFVDAPCSGTGTMRRHPEIPWRLSPEDIDVALPEIQLALLTEAASRVAADGELLFATCSVMPSENRSLIASFLSSKAGSGFELQPLSRAQIFRHPAFVGAGDAVSAHEDGDGVFRTVPVSGGFDGHFCARMVRRF